ncbi:uncharacterized protein [Miscanthus floridulus]|uniref:uncharacterized protein isoform X6 n=1 Tax=Miscanthus floridulus TaxID=154761 RepID=UPI003457B3A9
MQTCTLWQVRPLPLFIDCLPFNFCSRQDLVSKIAIVQNMKIPADEHVTALNSATGKKRLFHIGMNTVYSTKFRSNYVLKKSFKIDNEKYNPIDTPTNTIKSIHTNLTIDTSQAPNSQESSEGTSTRSTTATTDNEPATKKSKQAHNNTESDN